MHKLADEPEMTETIGPEGGFRLRYTLERHEITSSESRNTGRSGAYIRQRFIVIPVEERLGETVDEAGRGVAVPPGALGSSGPRGDDHALDLSRQF